MSTSTVPDGRRKGEQMKLYFYIRREVIGKDAHIIRCEECEVTEKPKSYYPVDRFPNGTYRSFIKKDEIGDFLDNYYDIVVLDKDDSEKAMELFEEHSKRRIEELNKSISIQKSILKAVEDYRKNG